MIASYQVTAMANAALDRLERVAFSYVFYDGKKLLGAFGPGKLRCPLAAPLD